MKNRYTLISDKIKDGYRVITSSTMVLELTRNKGAVMLGVNSLPSHNTKSEKGNPVTMRFFKVYIPTVELSLSVVTEVAAKEMGKGLN